MATEATVALARVLHQPETVLDRWLDAYVASKMRLPGSVGRDEVQSLIQPILSVLGEAIIGRPGAPPTQLSPGAGELRELEKSVAFLGATLANTGASGFDVAALLASLRDAFIELDATTRPEIAPYSEWLSALALDSFAAAKSQSARERLGEELTNGTPVIQVVQELPAILLVASPTTSVLDSLFGRFVLLCVRVGAVACIIDATGLADQENAAVLASVGRFLTHQRIASRVKVGLVGLSSEAEQRWLGLRGDAGTAVVCFPYFDRAVEWGLEALGYRLVKR